MPVIPYTPEPNQIELPVITVPELFPQPIVIANHVPSTAVVHVKSTECVVADTLV